MRAMIDWDIFIETIDDDSILMKSNDIRLDM